MPTHASGSSSRYDPEDEQPPTLGVREPLRPKTPPRSSGTTASLHYTPEPEAEAIAASARLT